VLRRRKRWNAGGSVEHYEWNIMNASWGALCRFHFMDVRDPSHVSGGFQSLAVGSFRGIVDHDSSGSLPLGGRNSSSGPDNTIAVSRCVPNRRVCHRACPPKPNATNAGNAPESNFCGCVARDCARNEQLHAGFSSSGATRRASRRASSSFFASARNDVNTVLASSAIASSCPIAALICFLKSELCK
jgi:hypothetical protein